MSVHDALHRTVTGRHEARRDQQAAIERDAAEITRQHELAALAIEPDAVQTAPQTSGGADEHTT